MRRRKDPVSRIDSKRVKQDINLEQAFPLSTDSVVRQKYLKKIYHQHGGTGLPGQTRTHGLLLIPAREGGREALDLL